MSIQPEEACPETCRAGVGTNGSKRTIHRGRRLVAIVASAIVGGYVAICVGLFLAQRRLIYFPPAGYGTTPRDLGLAYEDLTLTTEDGVGLAAWLVLRDGARATVLFCHGNADNMSDLCTSVRALHQLGYSVLLFDYRGYGRSRGQPSEVGLYRDAEAAWRYLTEVRGLPANRIVIAGRSLGGAVAIDLAARHAPAALVVECTFASLVDIGQRQYPLLPVGWLCRDRFESIKKIPKVSCPKLFLQGTADELIPLEDARRLFAAAAEPKQLIETPGQHNNAGFEYSSDYTRRLAEWLGAALSE